MKTDIEIANEAQPRPIQEIAAKLGICGEELYRYGDYCAKVSPKDAPRGKLILVTAINPTPAGEGKTTVSIGLADGLNRIGKRVALALREPSLGPVFGMKGGATGGGMSQILPMADINLHFTGDFHAITAANNLLCAMTDNSIYFGNPLKLSKVIFKRCMDCNDRALRSVVVGIGNGTCREDGFSITAASEIMATLCLASDFDDLKARLGEIAVGYDYDGNIVRAKALNAQNAMAILLKDAVKPNLVQTLEGVPAFVHGGPFANIAHGCNSVIATKTALSYADYVVTEAGFGADLGAEKFFDIKCRKSGLSPCVTVIVATVRALKYAGSGDLSRGVNNLVKHISNMRDVFNQRVVVAVNKFADDGQADIDYIAQVAKSNDAGFALCSAWGMGGEGGEELAELVARLADKPVQPLTLCYDDSDDIKTKTQKIAARVYGAKNVVWLPKAEKSIKKLGATANGLPVCIAKTQYSLSDDPKNISAQDFEITVRDIEYRGGAGFVVALAGEMMLMPGLPKTPNAVNMTIENEKIGGLF